MGVPAVLRVIGIGTIIDIAMEDNATFEFVNKAIGINFAFEEFHEWVNTFSRTKKIKAKAFVVNNETNNFGAPSSKPGITETKGHFNDLAETVRFRDKRRRIGVRIARLVVGMDAEATV
ncbi:hypothetical protein ACA910_008733 [Epithemia clementina (nom. ined.)]